MASQESEAIPVESTVVETESNPQETKVVEEKKETVEANKENENKNEQVAEPAVSQGVSHPLQTTWTIWYHKKPKTAIGSTKYEDLLHKIGSFNTVEGFWNFYTHLQRPSELTKNSNYSLFRNDEVPMWESFPKGGCWNLHISNKSKRLALLWERLALGTIGELFEEPGVVGIVVSRRTKDDVLSVWIRDQNQTIRFNVGEKLKQVLQLGASSTTIEYKNHSSSIKDRSTYRNGKLYVVPS